MTATGLLNLTDTGEESFTAEINTGRERVWKCNISLKQVLEIKQQAGTM